MLNSEMSAPLLAIRLLAVVFFFINALGSYFNVTTLYHKYFYKSDLLRMMETPSGSVLSAACPTRRNVKKIVLHCTIHVIENVFCIAIFKS